MKAITLHQPWASLIAVGAKKIETRSWAPPADLVGLRVGIHAGKKLVTFGPNSDFDRMVAKYLGPNWEKNIPRGAVVATAILRRWQQMTRENTHVWPEGDENLFGEYAVGRWMWHLADVHKLEIPVPARGYQGLWTWQR